MPVPTDAEWLTVRTTRDDVHPGDPAEPSTFRVSADTSDEEILRQAADPRWLPHISQSVVSWSITASEILGVVEHDCEAGRAKLMVMPWLEMRIRAADRADGVFRLHFNYHPLQDARTVFTVLQQVSLRDRLDPR